MTPLDDPRPFAEVLADWITRHGTVYAVSDGRILSAKRQSVANWLEGKPCLYEREVRALMTLTDRPIVPEPPVKPSTGPTGSLGDENHSPPPNAQ